MKIINIQEIEDEHGTTQAIFALDSDGKPYVTYTCNRTPQWEALPLPAMLPRGAVVSVRGCNLTPTELTAMHDDLEGIRDALENKNIARALDKTETLIQMLDLKVEEQHED